MIDYHVHVNLAPHPSAAQSSPTHRSPVAQVGGSFMPGICRRSIHRYLAAQASVKRDHVSCQRDQPARHPRPGGTRRGPDRRRTTRGSPHVPEILAAARSSPQLLCSSVSTSGRPSIGAHPQPALLRRLRDRMSHTSKPTVRSSAFVVAVSESARLIPCRGSHLGKQEPPAGIEPATCRLQGIRTPLLAQHPPR
jgi:hypothetical protein